MTFFQTLSKSIVVFLFLLLSMWWTLTNVVAHMSARWMPKSFFHFEQEKMAHIEFSVLNRNLFEATVFSLVALPGHLSVTNCGRGMFSGVDGWRRYLWFCLIPWLITYAQCWVMNISEFVWNVALASEATNFKLFTFLWLTGLLVQALLWFEVVCVALQGWILMKNANAEEYDDSTVRRMLFAPCLWYGFKNWFCVIDLCSLLFLWKFLFIKR